MLTPLLSTRGNRTFFHIGETKIYATIMLENLISTIIYFKLILQHENN